MRFFTCLLDPEGCGFPDAVRREYESLPRARGLSYHWQSAGSAMALTGWDDPYGPPLVVQDGEWLAAGLVRLDNRADLERWAGDVPRERTDLEVILRVVARHGTRYIPQVLGDFAFVVWNGSTHTAVAACDAFAVHRIYYAEHNKLYAFASRAEALALNESYDIEYLVRIVALYGPSCHQSVYAGVRTIPAGCMAVLAHSKLSIQQYWHSSGFEVEEAWERCEGEAVELCRQLLIQSVRLRLGTQGETWAQLSGGLDSSSIVSLVQWLAGRGDITHGLAGTVTHVDREGTGSDERQYSDAVVHRWSVRNETIVGAPAWYDEHYPPPRTDQPTFDLNVYPRERGQCAVVQKARGRVLLTGWGGDELFMGSMFFFADWLMNGRAWPALREMVHRAAIGRVSFWELAYRNALLPLLPSVVRNYLIAGEEHLAQPWLKQVTLRRYGLTQQAPGALEYAGPLGHKYQHAIATRVAELSDITTGGLLADTLEVRHPMLYRPLVEFALQLPPGIRARPHAHRWVLREAMRGIVPEQVRLRIGKQGTGAALAWSLKTAREHLAPLLRAPMLAELGVLDAGKLREAFDSPSHQMVGKNYTQATLLSTLSVEAWLQIRSGRWPCGGHLQ
ncbi:MAG: hypothetical protein H0W08_01210 [Acidobacteria bacterium]|nr:hypothetical protein [Acidobacteriota bacterium]